MNLHLQVWAIEIKFLPVQDLMFAGVLKRYIDGYSEAYFYGPKVKQSINALLSCIDYAHLAKYDRTVYVDLIL